MKIRYMTICTTLVFAGLSAIAIAASPDKCSPWPSCKGDGGGGGGTEAEHTAALIMGGFRFAAVDVTPTRQGNTYRSDSTLLMNRPLDDPDQTTWDGVFEACLPTPVLSNPLYNVFVGRDSWEITNSGGNVSGTAGSDVRIRFHDIIDGTADIDFDLIGELDFDGQFLPAPGSTSIITLINAKIFASDTVNHLGCNSGEFPLQDSVRLEICHRLENGTGCD